MSAVTYTGKIVRSSKTASSTQKGFFARLLEAVVAARKEQAEREYARYVQIHGRDPVA
ncbi:hypothetical protein K9U40_13555 [Xanthobacter autotrophicus]|uniref:hypothetical protein n=1 Tax=Xanthobacter TaxID=279 RepID=UPI0024AC54AA|nr:hypothetical protein [Xanthobacter autotrophicus]MDI4665345.1 hypothetical protein [Xanthobacter autotrophicus]